MTPVRAAAPTTPHRRRLFLAVILVALIVTTLSCSGGPGAPPDSVHVLTANGVVGPVMERYLDRGIGAAED